MVGRKRATALEVEVRLKRAFRLRPAAVGGGHVRVTRQSRQLLCKENGLRHCESFTL